MADYEGLQTDDVNLLVEVYDNDSFERDGVTFRRPVMSIHPDDDLAFGQRDPYLSTVTTPSGRAYHGVPVNERYVDEIVKQAGDNAAPIHNANGDVVGMSYSVKAKLLDLKSHGETIGKIPDVSTFGSSDLPAGMVDGESVQERMADNIGFANTLWQAKDKKVRGVDIGATAKTIYDALGDPEAVKAAAESLPEDPYAKNARALQEGRPIVWPAAKDSTVSDLIGKALDHPFRTVSLTAVMGAVLRDPGVAETVKSCVQAYMSMQFAKQMLNSPFTDKMVSRYLGPGEGQPQSVTSAPAQAGPEM